MIRGLMGGLGLALAATYFHAQAAPVEPSQRLVRPAELSKLSSAEKPLLPLALRPAAQAQTATATGDLAGSQRALLKKYCITCHSDRLKTAQLTLEQLDVEHVRDGAEIWEKVVRKVRAGAMPPAGSPRPEKTVYEGFASWLETELDRSAAANPHPGRPVVRRLNRFEYTNAVRDLLALEIDGRSLLPTDESGYGFDNIGDVLSFSPGLLERYMSAARKISRLSIGDPTLRPSIDLYKVSPFLVQEERVSEDLPFGSRGGTVIRYNFPADGEYVVSVKLGRRFDNDANSMGLTRQGTEHRCNHYAIGRPYLWLLLVA